MEENQPEVSRRRRPFGVLIATAVLVFALIVIAFTVPMLPADRDVLTVSFARGEAVLESADGSRIPLVEGTAVSKGDRVIVPDGSAVSLAAADGHNVTVTDAATLGATANRKTLLGNNFDTELKLDGGKIRVSGEGKPRSSLAIGLPNGVAGVRGTVFEARAAKSQAFVSVHEGNVAISGTSRSAFEIGQGQGVILSATGPVIKELPDPPEWVSSEFDSVVRAPDKQIEWKPAPDASGYIAEFSADPEFLEIVSSARVEGTEATIPLADVERPILARVSSISRDGLVGLPSDPIPIRVAYHWSRALELREAEDTDGSFAEFDIALTRHPSEAWLWRDLGWSLYLEGRNEEARNAYLKGLELDPTNGEIQVELARIHYRLEEYDKAEAAYLSLLERDPDHAHALWGLGDLYRVLGRREEAIVVLEKALALRPNHSYAQATLDKVRGGS